MLDNIPAWIWAWLATLLVGWFSGKKLLDKILLFVQAADEFLDIVRVAIEAYRDDRKITPNEWTKIEQEFYEFKLKLDEIRNFKDDKGVIK